MFQHTVRCVRAVLTYKTRPCLLTWMAHPATLCAACWCVAADQHCCMNVSPLPNHIIATGACPLFCFQRLSCFKWPTHLDGTPCCTACCCVGVRVAVDVPCDNECVADALEQLSIICAHARGVAVQLCHLQDSTRPWVWAQKYTHAVSAHQDDSEHTKDTDT